MLDDADNKAIAELRAMAHVYRTFGRSAQASKLESLAEEMEARSKKADGAARVYRIDNREEKQRA